MITQEIISIGRLCAELNAMPDEVRKAAEELGIELALRIDRSDYYDSADKPRINERIKQNR